MSLVVIDADVLGRARTGDETYVLEPAPRAARGGAPELRFAAVTRQPELVPDGVEPIALPARFQELRMAWSLPRAAAPAAPGARALPARAAARLAGPGRRDAPRPLVRARPVGDAAARPRSSSRPSCRAPARRAEHVLAVSERTKRDIVELYGVAPEKITVTPNGVDPAFSPGDGEPGDVPVVRGICPAAQGPARGGRCRPRGRAAARRRRAGERPASSRASSSGGGADLRGYVDAGRARRALPRRGVPRAAVALRGLRPARARGDGLRDARSSPRREPRCARSPARRRSTPSPAAAERRAARRSPTASASSRPGSSARSCSRGRRRRGAPPRSTGEVLAA